MLPFAIPSGTTLDALLTRVLPAEHAARVAANASRDPFVAVVQVTGAAGEAARSYTLTVRGATLEVTSGEATKRDAWLVVEGEAAGHMLTDLAARAEGGALRPQASALMVTDPQIVRRVQMIQGTLGLALRGFAPAHLGGKTMTAAMTIAAGAAAKKPIALEPADVTLETGAATFDDLLAGKLAPDAALADDRVTLRGKKLVAMQFALALAPLFPVPR